MRPSHFSFLNKLSWYSLLTLITGLMAASLSLGHGDAHPGDFSSEMSGPRGIVNLNWQADNITRTFTAGYPDTFGLYSFFRRQPSNLYIHQGKQCIKSNFLAFDIDDNASYNIDKTIELELLFDASQTDTVLYGYDANGQTEAGGKIPPPAKHATDFKKITISLPRARFANRGMDGADFALFAEGTAVLEEAEQLSTFGLCGINIKLENTASTQSSDTQQPLADVNIEWLNNGKPSAVRFGLYDSKGRAALPSKDALKVNFYNKTKQQLQLKNYQPKSQPWPHTNRYVLYSDGQYQTQIPAGRYNLVATKGPEYRVINKIIDVASGKTNKLTIDLERWDDLPSQGWYSGDVHIHMNRQNKAQNNSIMAFLQAEDVHISNLLLMSNASNAHFGQYAYGKAGEYHKDNHSIIPGIEGPRTAQRGHAIALNIKEPIIDGDSYFLYHTFMENYHKQNAINGYAHVGSEEFNASWGLALDVPFGLIDFVEIMQDSELRTTFWYEFLNLGYPLSPAAGSDFPYFDQPGSVRSYAYINNTKTNNSATPTPQAWFNALKSGNTFVSNGPSLTFTVNGHPMGSQLKLDEQKNLHIKSTVKINPDLDDIEKLELISCGNIIKTITSADRSQHSLDLEFDIVAEKSQWLAVRASGKNYALAHSAPIYISDKNGFSGCKEKSDDIITAMKSRLNKLSATPIEINRELEYWDTSKLKSQYQSQLSALQKRILLAHKHYDDLREKLN